jgi:hypothetical protein
MRQPTIQVEEEDTLKNIRKKGRKNKVTGIDP